MSRRGLTMIELVIGLAIAGMMSIVIAALVRGGVATYVFTTQQSAAATGARKAFVGDGKDLGMLPTIDEGASFANLSSTSVAVSPSAGPATTFSIVSHSLVAQLGVSQTFVSSNTTALSVQYFGMSGSGLIEAAPTSTAAVMATIRLDEQSTASASKTYSFFSGARLRTGP